jgi:hypothetical protein
LICNAFVGISDGNQRPIIATKIDIDGAEYNAFKGGTGVLMNAQKILTEFFPFALRQFGRAPEEYLEMLVNAGFDLFKITKNGEAQSIDRYQWKRVIPDGRHHTDILCIKET